MTAWSDQRDAMLDTLSRQHAAPAKREFIALRDRQLVAHAGEQKTKRQVLDALRRKHESLRAAYLRITGTTYAGWLEHGPHAEWEEVLAAAADDATWDRLVERIARQHQAQREKGR
jgi:hypothetical protein